MKRALILVDSANQLVCPMAKAGLNMKSQDDFMKVTGFMDAGLVMVSFLTVMVISMRVASSATISTVEV